ncbi:FIG00568972: hypothetical protein [uncultured Synechococcales cyanobacterium]|uniref:DUF1822 family protein n=1 Tax=uncultured Synechococcales cyanobacterium TaxID=1936017 RepID=A0A6J4VXM4_9CYAN|nr:FIG00568972: hypothetical protein [uncultured Synechococcales cyanobacterium]
MTSNTPLPVLAALAQLWLEISPAEQSQAWQQSQRYSTSSSRWNAYLNQICLSAVLPWIGEECGSQAAPWPAPAALPSFWEVISGSAIAVDRTRFVLIPTETIDLSELRVPQEWVDIPEWAADYYLAVQIIPDEGLVRVWGYTTHQQLKASGSYDPGDRTYCLDEDNVIQDLSILWVARQLCPEEPTRGVLPSLPTLPLAQAESLLQRLGNPSVVTPRLAVPFELWAALLAHGGWRQRLYEQRQGLLEQWTILQWLRAGVSGVAQQIGWSRVDFQPSLVGARGSEQTSATSALSRQLVIAGQSYELRVFPQGNPKEKIWRFELQSSSLDAPIPGGFKLRLLTEDLQAFENNEDVATTPVERLYILVALEPGDSLVWETEPIPENYDREILRF